MSARVKWVLWERSKGEKQYTLRRGRYASKEAAEDAVPNLPATLEYLPLPEGKKPQANLRP